MPSRKPLTPVLDGEGGDVPTADDVSQGDALALAEEAEAEAQEAEAVAAAARARARAIRLRRQAEEVAKAETGAAGVPEAGVPEAEEATPDESTDAVDYEAEAQQAQELTQSSAEEVVSADEAGSPTRSRSRLWLTATGIGVVVLAIVAMLAASGYMTWHHRSVMAEQRRSAEFAAAARQGVVTLMSLDYNHAKDDVKRIIDSTTGEFKKDFESSADDFVKVAESSKVVTKANITATAVQSMDDDSAVVLLAATSTVSNTAGKEQDPRHWRLSVTVTRDGDQIKLSKVEFVP